jgi:small subunit ribosomal protein S2
MPWKAGRDRGVAFSEPAMAHRKDLCLMANAIVQEMIEAGVHFGHRTSLWNPKMAPYIFGRKNQIHILDIRETLRGMLRAKKYLSQVAAGGSLILLGGTLTNFRTIRSRLTRLEELEQLRNSDEINAYSKKMQSALNREHRKMYRNLNGLRTMNRLPEVLFIVDPGKERNAVREAKRLGITTVALIDTDSDPTQVDLPIPGNDDGIRSVELILKQLADAIIAGKGEAEGEAAAAAAAAAEQSDQPVAAGVSSEGGSDESSQASAEG